MITETLQLEQRAGVQQLVEALGRATEKNLTKKSTILEVSIPNPSLWTEGVSAPRRLTKTAKLRAAVSPIEVLTEEEIFQRLGDEQLTF